MKSGLTAARSTYFPMKSSSAPYKALKACQVSLLAETTVVTWDWKVLSKPPVVARVAQPLKDAVEMEVAKPASVVRVVPASVY